MNLISKIVVSSLELTLKKDLSDNLKSLGLKAGQILKARVAGDPSGNTVKLNILGNDVTAKTHTPLKAGDVIDLVVTKAGPQINLKLVSKPDMPGNSGFDSNTQAGKLMNLLNSLKVLGRPGPFDDIKTILEKGAVSDLTQKESPEIEKLTGKLLNILESGQTPKSTKPSVVFTELNRVASKLIRWSGLSVQGALKNVKPEQPSNVREKPLELPVKFLNVIKNINVKSFFESLVKQSVSQPGQPGQPGQSGQSGDKNQIIPQQDMVPDKIHQEVKPGLPLDKNLLSELVVIKKDASKILDVLNKNPEIKIISDKNLSLSLLRDTVKLYQAFESLSDKVMAKIPSVRPEVSKPIDAILQHLGLTSQTAASPEEKDMNTVMLNTLKLIHQVKSTRISRVSITRLTNLVEQLSLKSDKPDLRILNNLINRSGQQFEKNLSQMIRKDPETTPDIMKGALEKDIKGLALRLLSISGDDVNELTNNLKKFVNNTEKLQLVNRAGLDDSGKFLLQLPVTFDESFKFGQLLIDLKGGQKSGKNGEKPVKVAFLLEMSNLGDIKADFSIYKKYINGSFVVGSRESQAKITAAFPELKKSLLKHEFQVYKLECHVVKPEELSKMSLLDEMTPAETGVLNLIV